MKHSVWVERHGSNWRVRARVVVKDDDGQLRRKVKVLRRFGTETEAEEFAARVRLFSADPERQGKGMSLDEYAAGVWVSERADRRAGVDEDERRWNGYVQGTALGKRSVTEVREVDVRAWARALERRKTRPRHRAKRDAHAGKQLSRSTVSKALVVVRRVLEHAVEGGLLTGNPATGIKARGKKRTTDEEFEFVPADKIKTLIQATPKRHRHLVAFAIFTGLRMSEQWGLRWDDVSENEIIVRYGDADGSPTKGGKPRRIPIFGPAREALLAAKRLAEEHAELARRGKRVPPRRPDLVFPGEQGARTASPQDWWKGTRETAGLEHIHWHSLRHTCATALIGGWWGEPWSLEKVRKMLGHTTVRVTEKYAHVLGIELQEAAEGIAVGADFGITDNE